jgi:DNA polymerase III delta' subunit
MDGIRTRGQPAAVEAIAAMVGGTAPHAVLLSGPAGVGKTTLALDLAAALLCTPSTDAARPCRTCRACRMVEHGNHPDLHWLRPEGPAGQVVIGGPDARFRGVRDLVAELALLPVEGGARVAVVEHADRMNEDAQNALLKTLEEPPRGVTIVLCADEEEKLLPTVRSRCARVRLGPVGPRAIEAILAEHDAADAPTAARLGRLAGGRPGLALAYARTPEALTIRHELTRTVLDLVDARVSARFEALRGLVPRASVLVALLEPAASVGAAAASGPVAARAPSRGRGRSRPAAAGAAPAASDAVVADPDAPAGQPAELADDGPRAVPAAERRRAVALLLAIWTDLARDLALAGLGEEAGVRQPDLLEELGAVALDIPPAAVATFLGRLAVAGERLDANVAPELVLDSVVLAWPQRTRVA